MGNPTARKAVLLVEDEADLRDLLAFEFTSKGFDVHCAADGDAAICLFAAHHIDLVVSDIRMPSCDGVDLLDQIKSVDVDKPVLLISAYTDLTIEGAYAIGAEGLFEKPFRLSNLVASARRILEAPDKRWRTPPESFPDLCLALRQERASSPPNGVIVGRGGMYVCPAGTTIAVGTPVAFEVEAEIGALRRLRGAGVVRWIRECKRSPHDHGGSQIPACGIEFTYLDENVRGKLAEWMRQARPRAYIPSPHREHWEKV